MKQKKFSRKRIIAGCIFACLLLLFVCLAFAYYTTSVKKAESGWKHLPAETSFAFEAYEVDALLTALHKDGLVKILLSIMKNEDPEVADALTDNGITLPILDDEMIGHFQDYLRAGSLLRSIVTPKTAIMGISNEYGEKMVYTLFQAPSWINICYWFLPYADGTIHPYDDEAEQPVYFTRYQGWIIASESYALVEKIVESWDKSLHPFGLAPESRKPNVKLAVLNTPMPTPIHQQHEEPNQEDNPFLSGMTTFNLDIRPQEKKTSYLEDGQLHLLIELEAGEWVARKSWLPSEAPDKDKAEFIIGDQAFPPEKNPKGSESENVLNFSFTLPKQNHDFRDAIDTVATPPIARVDNATKSLAWIWARWGWLENCSGEFVIIADAVDFDQEFATSELVLPFFTLGWITRGDHARAVREFEDGLNLFLASALAPGGNILFQGIKNSIVTERFTNPLGSGTSFDLPGALTYWINPAWLLSTPRSEGSGLGFITTNKIHLPGNEAMYLFDWPGFSFLKPTVWIDQYAFAGRWQIIEAFRANLPGIVDELTPTISNFAPEAGKSLELVNLAVKKILPLYPRGSTTGFYNPATGVAAVKTRITRN